MRIPPGSPSCHFNDLVFRRSPRKSLKSRPPLFSISTAANRPIKVKKPLAVVGHLPARLWCTAHIDQYAFRLQGTLVRTCPPSQPKTLDTIAGVGFSVRHRTLESVIGSPTPWPKQRDHFASFF